MHLCRRARLISWQLFVHRVTTISPTVDFFLNLDRSQNRESEMDIFSSPNEIPWSTWPSRLRYICHQGHTGDAREDAHMVIVKAMIKTLKHRWGRCPISTVACKAETKSLKGRWQRSILGPKSEIECQKDLESRISLGYQGGSWRCRSFVSCSFVVSQPVKQSHSEASSGLTSPPSSHWKPQLRPLATSPVGISATATPCINHTRHGQTHERLQLTRSW